MLVNIKKNKRKKDLKREKNSLTKFKKLIKDTIKLILMILLMMVDLIKQTLQWSFLDQWKDLRELLWLSNLLTTKTFLENIVDLFMKNAFLKKD
jgi:hypothetical protein